MSWLIEFVVAVLRAVVPWLVKESRPTAEDGDPDRPTRDKLRQQVRKHWREP